MLTFNNVAGKLLELRAQSPLTVAEMQQGVQSIGAILARNPATMVCCADFRKLGVMSDEVTQIIVKTMRADNPRIARAAYLLADTPMAKLQWDRLVREGLNPNRKLFHDMAELNGFVDALLDGPERERLAAFYAEA